MKWDGGAGAWFNATTGRTSLGLGTAAVANLGTGDSDAAYGNHNHTGVYLPLSGGELSGQLFLNYSITADGLIVGSGRASDALITGNLASGTNNLLALDLGGSNKFKVDYTGAIKTVIWNGTTIAVADGGTGKTSITNNAYLRGNSSGGYDEVGATDIMTDMGINRVKSMVVQLIGPDVVWSVEGSTVIGKFSVPYGLDGWSVYRVHAHCYTVGTGTAELNVGRSAGPENTTLTTFFSNTKVYIESNEYDSMSATTQPNPNQNLVVNEGQFIFVTCDEMGTGRKGLDIRIDFIKN